MQREIGTAIPRKTKTKKKITIIASPIVILAVLITVGIIIFFLLSFLHP